MGRKLKSKATSNMSTPPYAEPPHKFDHEAWDLVEQAIYSGNMSLLDDYFGADIASTRIASVLRAVVLYLSKDKVRRNFPVNFSS